MELNLAVSFAVLCAAVTIRLLSVRSQLLARARVLPCVAAPTRRVPARLWIFPFLHRRYGARVAVVAGVDRAARLLFAWQLGAGVLGLAGVGKGAVAAISLVGGWMVGAMVLLHAAEQRHWRRMQEALPSLSLDLVRSLQSGRSLLDAFATAAPVLAPPLRDEISRVVASAGVAGMIPALHDWKHRFSLALPTGRSMRHETKREVVAHVHALVMVVSVGQQEGGALTVGLLAWQDRIRERAVLRGEVRALAAQALASALVMVAAPVAFFAYLLWTEPRAATFVLHSRLGSLATLTGLVLDMLGAWWMHALVRRAAS